MRTGWIKIHRKMLDNPIVAKDADHLAVWIWLLCEAAYEPHQRLFGKKKITLQPGQLITSAQYIASELLISESKAKRILKAFESDRQIEQQTTRYGRVISILRWDKYQDDERHSDRRVTDEWPTSDRRVTATKEYKEDKEGKNNTIKDSISSTDVPRSIRSQVMEEWNKLPLTQLKTIKEGTTRYKLLRARVKEYGLDQVLQAIRSIGDSPFLLGQNDRSWTITFDWLVKPNNFPKVLEGNYLDRAKNGEQSRFDMSDEEFNRIIEEHKGAEEWTST